MLRAVLDTNVIVSAMIRPQGVPGQILQCLLEEAFVLVLSPSLLAELSRVLRRPRVRKYIRLSDQEIDRRSAQLETLADPVPGRLRLKVDVRDPEDVMFLIAALEGRADCIVTGDDALLTLGIYESVAIVKPRAFLNRLSR